MATEQHNKAVRNTTELEWLHFYSIFLTGSLKDGTVRIDKRVRNKTGCDPEMQTGKLENRPQSTITAGKEMYVIGDLDWGDYLSHTILVHAKLHYEAPL